MTGVTLYYCMDHTHPIAPPACICPPPNFAHIIAKRPPPCVYAHPQIGKAFIP